MSSPAGNARENRALEHLVAQGYTGICGRASRGPADIIAIKRGDAPLMVQVKGDERGPWAHFRKPERAALMTAALEAGAVAWLCWMPSLHKAAVWFHWTEWPKR